MVWRCFSVEIMEDMSPLLCQKCLFLCGQLILQSSQTARRRFSSEKITFHQSYAVQFLNFLQHFPVFWICFLDRSGYFVFPDSGWCPKVFASLRQQMNCHPASCHCWAGSALVVIRFLGWITGTGPGTRSKAFFTAGKLLYLKFLLMR